MNKLKEFRISQGLTQEQMARRLGFTLSMYYCVERGRTGASRTFMKAFKREFPAETIDDIFFAEK